MTHVAEAPMIASPIADPPELDLRIVEILPAPGEWTEDEYLWLTDRTNHLVEFCEGRIEVLPMPTDFHQGIVGWLYEHLVAYFRPRGGKVRLAPLRVRLFSGRFREPDLVVLASADDPRRENRYWHGADLVVEIVSPDDPKRDLVTKREEYAQAGISEYWIVDPRTESITVLRLEGQVYVEHGTFGRGDIATSARFEGLAAEVDAVFDAD